MTDRKYLLKPDDHHPRLIPDRAFLLQLLAVSHADPIAALIRLDREGGIRICGAEICVSEEVKND